LRVNTTRTWQCTRAFARVFFPVHAFGAHFTFLCVTSISPTARRNPAPVVLPDGSVRVMAHTDWAPWAGEVILEAPSWKGPYTVVGSDLIDHCSYCEEDAFMWKDKRGNWHVLYHRMFDPAGPLDPNWGEEDGSWKRPGTPIPSPGERACMIACWSPPFSNLFSFSFALCVKATTTYHHQHCCNRNTNNRDRQCHHR
jgi:hypothetical protein